MTHRLRLPGLNESLRIGLIEGFRLGVLLTPG
jgi:hypothetical protein